MVKLELKSIENFCNFLEKNLENANDCIVSLEAERDRLRAENEFLRERIIRLNDLIER